ncbi:MAG: 16S rRNA (guanine1516-N2)-methyltransferase [Candidatus Azotimanducaceae bacterium]
MVRFQLYRDNQGYCLDDTCSAQNPLRLDFSEPGFLRRLNGAGKKSELVARAVKAAPGVRVLDCTGGFGRDSMILAKLGCKITLLERSYVMWVLLSDALSKARQSDSLKEPASRIALRRLDAASLLSDTVLNYDVVYLDPMFPPKHGSAAVNGDMQQLQRFLSGGSPAQHKGAVDQSSLSEADQLLEMSLNSGVKRVVLKRPAKGGASKLTPPAHTFSNKSSRFEVHLR